MFHRPRRPLMSRGLINTGQMDEFDRANRFLNNGQPEKAAELFEEIAEQMEQCGRMRQAANIHAQAAHAWVNAGNEARAMNQARTALTLFSRLRMPVRLIEFRERFAQHLQERGMPAAAGNFRQEMKSSEPPATQPTAGSGRGLLPAQCPKCGAPLRSDLVEWIDDRSAECDFCGSVILSMD